MIWNFKFDNIVNINGVRETGAYAVIPLKWGSKVRKNPKNTQV